MLAGFYKHFVCDVCGVSAFMKILGSGWIWYREIAGEIKHACPLCIESVPKDKRRNPGDKN